jgi:hypothetical protein
MLHTSVNITMNMAKPSDMVMDTVRHYKPSTSTRTSLPEYQIFSSRLLYRKAILVSAMVVNI